MHRTARAALAASVCALGFASAALGGVSTWVPLEIRDGRVLFPVEVSGVAGSAMFDTGAQGHSIGAALVEKAGLPLNGRKWVITGVGSTDDVVSSVSSLPIKLFGIDFKLRDVPALPHQHDLIIGAGFLKAAVLQLDYPNNRMRLITHDAVDMEKASNVPMKLEDSTGLPAIQVTIDGKPRWMLLDTGNTGPIIVRRMIAQEGGWIGRFKRSEAQATDVNAAVSALDLLVLPSVVIGPFELEDVPVVIPAQGEGINISGVRASGPIQDSRIRKGVRVSGIVGYEILRHFVVTIDYDRQKMNLSAPAAAPEKSAAAEAPAATAETRSE